MLFALAAMVILGIALGGCSDGRPPNEVNTIEDASGRIIGALSGTPSARLAEEIGTARLYNSTDELIYGLNSGSVDCAVMESIVASETVSGTQGLRILSETLTEYELSFAVPRENAELLTVVNSVLAALRSNGTLRNLRDKYLFGGNYVYKPPEGVEQRGGTLTLAIAPDSPPYSYKDDNGEFTGLDVEVARAICDYLGVGLEIIEVDVKELVTAVWFGKASLAAGWLPGDIDEQVNTTDAYASTAYVVVVRR